MKTLLLSLVVVAFMCLDSGHTIKCRSCNLPIGISSEDCPDAKACYTKKYGPLGVMVKKGCATECTFPASGVTIQYCTKDKCNQ